MNRWVRAWCVGWLAAAGLWAAPLLDEPVATLTLNDGTVLRQAQAKGFLTKVVLVRHEGGVRTVPYELFPEKFQATLELRREAALAAVKPEAQSQPGLRTSPPRTAPSGPASKWEMPAMCRLTAAGGTDQVVLVKIENLTDYVVAVHPWQIVVRTRAGRLVSGTHWVGLNDAGQVVVTLRNRQLLDGRGEVTLGLAISPGLEGDAVAAVLWK